MQQTQDPMLPAFQNRDDRSKVDAVLLKTYGPKKDESPNARKKAKERKKKRSTAKAS